MLRDWRFGWGSAHVQSLKTVGALHICRRWRWGPFIREAPGVGEHCTCADPKGGWLYTCGGRGGAVAYVQSFTHVQTLGGRGECVDCTSAEGRGRLNERHDRGEADALGSLVDSVEAQGGLGVTLSFPL
jgi:hypothetical protein